MAPNHEALYNKFEDDGVAEDFVEAMRAETGSFRKTQIVYDLSEGYATRMRRKLRRRSENHRVHASKKKRSDRMAETPEEHAREIIEKEMRRPSSISVWTCAEARRCKALLISEAASRVGSSLWRRIEENSATDSR